MLPLSSEGLQDAPPLPGLLPEALPRKDLPQRDLPHKDLPRRDLHPLVRLIPEVLLPKEPAGRRCAGKQRFAKNV